MSARSLLVRQLECVACSIEGVAQPEQWRPVVGYEGLYEVSSLGRVRSFVVRKPDMPPRIMRIPQGTKYLKVRLSRSGVAKTQNIHTLVLMAFAGPPNPGQHGCHYNGDCHDNRACNLRWGSPRENGADTRRLGTARRGERHRNAKLRIGDIQRVRDIYACGVTQQAIAWHFGVGRRCIGRILDGTRWGHLP